MKILKERAYLNFGFFNTSPLYLRKKYRLPTHTKGDDDWSDAVLATIAEYEPGVYKIVLSDKELNFCLNLYYELRFIDTGRTYYAYEDNNRNIIDLCIKEYASITGLLEPAMFIYLVKEK